MDFYIKKLKNSGCLEGTIDTTKLANETDGFSGADLEYLTYETVENVVLNSKDEEKVIIDTSNFINTIKGLKKNKSQEPEGKQVNDGLESFNNLLDNADNVESHSSANSSSDVVVTQQLAKDANSGWLCCIASVG